MKVLENIKGYFDYCISEQCYTSSDFHKTAKLLYQYGYRTIAVNQIIDESSIEPKKKKKKGEQREDIVPPPIPIKYIEECTELKILNRLTIIFSTTDIMHKFNNSANYKLYHIVAVMPMTQTAYQFTCSNIAADIFSFEAESKINYKMNRKLYNQLVSKGFHFEIFYAPAIQSSTLRKNVINVSHLYHAFGKSRNIIISSGAMNHLLVRSPQDVINLGYIFGLNNTQCRQAILDNGKNVYNNSVVRRMGKALIFVETPDDRCSNIIEEIKDEEMDLDEPALKKSKQ